MENDMGMFPNVLHGDKWRITFSNIPTLEDMSDMRYFDNYVKTTSIPSYSVGEIVSQLPMGMQIRHPLGGMKRNQELSDLAMTFKLSEDMFNYMVFFEWMQQLRYGQIDPRHDDYFRKYSIKRIVISMLDNQKRVVSDVTFTNVLIGDLSALDLVFGTTEELSFTCTFRYEEIFYKTKDPMTHGTNPLPRPEPLDCGTSGMPINPIIDWNEGKTH